MLTDTNPAGRYWIKLDGTDVKEALQHSVKDKWAGDVDVNDNKLQQLREEYESRVSFIKSCTSTANVNTAMEQLLLDLEADQTFLDTAFKAASKELRKKFDKKNANCEILKALNWDVVECNSLLQECMNFIHKFSNNCEFCAVAKSVESDYQLYLKNFFKKKRTAATHVLVIAVSDERRSSKPYTLPVQYLPYKSLRDQYIRDITAPLNKTMTDAGLEVVGEYLNLPVQLIRL